MSLNSIETNPIKSIEQIISMSDCIDYWYGHPIFTHVERNTYLLSNDYISDLTVETAICFILFVELSENIGEI